MSARADITPVAMPALRCLLMLALRKQLLYLHWPGQGLIVTDLIDDALFRCRRLLMLRADAALRRRSTGVAGDH